MGSSTSRPDTSRIKRVTYPPPGAEKFFEIAVILKKASSQPAASQSARVHPMRTEHDPSMEHESSQAALLDLPPELRNIIYTEVLVSKDPINVPTTGFSEPALLQVCKRIRSEVSPIYYGLNTFDTETQNYDSFLNLKVTQKMRAVEKEHKVRPKLTGIVYGNPHWKNLAVWLQR